MRKTRNAHQSHGSPLPWETNHSPRFFLLGGLAGEADKCFNTETRC